jgi:oligopeptidase B
MRTAAAEIPPVAPVHEHSEVRHGELIVDNYFWLRDTSNPEVVKYLDAENAYTEAMTTKLKPFQEALYKEILGRFKQTDLSVPVRRGNYLYYIRTEEGKHYPIRCRRKGTMDAREEIILDPNELTKTHKFVGIGPMAMSDDDNMLAYTVDFTGFRQFTLQIKDLGAGQVLPDTFERVTSAVWPADNKILFLTTEDAVTKRSYRLWRHLLGSKQFDLMYEEKDEYYNIELSKTRNRRYLLLRIDAKDTSECHYLRADHPEKNFTVFSRRERGHRYYIDHREDSFYIRTNRLGANFAIVTAPENDPDPGNWAIFQAHRKNVLLRKLDLFREFAVLFEKSNTLHHLRIYNFQTARWAKIKFPEAAYQASPGGTPEYTSQTYRYKYQSFTTPPSIYDYDPQSGQSKLLKIRDIAGYDPESYIAKRIWVTARDGVKVPVSILYKRGFKHNGKAPLLLYGYGAYGIGASPSFSISRLSLLDRGVAVAAAHVRGGDELGWKWRADGMLMKKKNTFFDFIDCAEFLIQRKWTSKDRLIIEGGSAGGLLVGAVTNMRPDLFRAVHLGVPFVDLINTMMDPLLPHTVDEYLEWGNPNEKAAYQYMKTYSPYDNLDRHDYPAMLVTTSLNDSQVMYWESAKYVAKMRTLKTDKNPLLLKVKMENAGHEGASGRYDRIRDQAFEYAWMLSETGVTE